MQLVKTIEQDLESGDLVITFTDDELSMLGFEEGDRLLIEESDGGLVITKA